MSSATYTPPEVAKLLRVSPDKVISWIRSGELLAFDVRSKAAGRPRYRIFSEELDRFTPGKSGGRITTC